MEIREGQSEEGGQNAETCSYSYVCDVQHGDLANTAVGQFLETQSYDLLSQEEFCLFFNCIYMRKRAFTETVVVVISLYM